MAAFQSDFETGYRFQETRSMSFNQSRQPVLRYHSFAADKAKSLILGIKLRRTDHVLTRRFPRHLPINSRLPTLFAFGATTSSNAPGNDAPCGRTFAETPS
jgi:hypothetical protein